jgi:hypothetical protein
LLLIDRKNLEVAASLIAKAQRTDFDGEAIALVEKSYAFLAKVITAYDDAVEPSPSGTRRCERRLLRDRRATRRRAICGTSDRQANPAHAYRELDRQPRHPDETGIDFEA